MAKKKKIARECEPFRSAQSAGTDNESYGRLVQWTGEQLINQAIIGTDLPPIKFCPWCGTELPDLAHQARD